jgi:regulatory protein
MLITKLEEIEKGKIKVFIDEEYQFLLFQKEVKEYHLKENDLISETLVNDIIENVIKRRAKQKALALLKVMDRTEQELIYKLKQAHFTDTIIEAAIYYVKTYHYIDDSRYAANYIRAKMNSKSKRQLQTELIKKGIEKEIMEKAFLDEYNDEDSAIQKAIQKKNVDIMSLSKEEKLKLSSYLYRKGFKLDLIRKYVGEYGEDNII